MVNLVDDAWLPAQWKGGGRERVSLRVALTRAGELRGLAIEPPTLLSAVMRHVLLPVWFSALGQPSSRAEWRDRFERGGLDAQQGQLLDLYLDTWRSSFDLFSPERPFAQVAGLETSAGETKPVSLLVPSVATGNNVPMFTSFTEAHAYEMTPEDAALWLLHAQCWDTAAIKTGAKDDEQAKKGKTTGNPTGPLGQLGVILPEGRTLYETLLLNTLVSWDAKAAGNAAGVGREDYPQWQSPEPHTSSWRKRPAAGPLDTLTWQSRRIRLVPEDTADGVRVRRVVVCRRRPPGGTARTGLRTPHRLELQREAQEGRDADEAATPPAGRARLARPGRAPRARAGGGRRRASDERAAATGG